MSSTVSPNSTTTANGVDCTRTQIDPRGPRFGGAVTTVVLALALVLVGTPAGTVLVAWQTLVFALGAIVGLHAQPYGIVFRKVIRPRLSPPAASPASSAASIRSASGSSKWVTKAA